jgi:hypothetical protein
LQCAEACKEGGDPALSFLKDMAPVQQLEYIWQPIGEAKLDWQAKGGGSRLDMWTSPLLERHCKTLRHLNVSELGIGALLIGHENFRGFELLEEAKKTFDGFFVMPWYLVNYCLDEQRHELHVVGGVLRPDKSLLIVDPNGIVPEDFGVPNVVMVRLPWTK